MSTTITIHTRNPLAQLLALLLIFPCAASLFAQDVTLAQFERDLKQLSDSVDNIVDAEFEPLEIALAELSKPLAVGETVKVEIRRGNAREAVEGRYNGVVGQYVRISSKSILLSDIAEEQRDRFIISQYPERRDSIIAERRQALEDGKEHQRRKLRPTIFREGGYGPDFFEKNLRIGDRIVKPQLLGDGKIFAVLIAVEGEDQVLCRILNRGAGDAAAVAVLGGRGVGASTSTDKPDTPWTGEFSFYLPRSRFANIDQFLKSFRLVCHNSRMGAWRLTANPQTKRKSGTVDRGGVAMQVHQIMIAFDLAGFERGDLLRGKLSTVTEVRNDVFRQRLAEAAVFQEDLAKIRAAAAAARAKDAAETAANTAINANARDAANAELSAALGPRSPAASDVRLEVVKPLIEELRQANVDIAALPRDQASKPGELGSIKIANHLAPTAVNDVAIFGGTQWRRLTVRPNNEGQSIDFAQYRFLFGNREDEPAAILQVSGMFASNVASIANFTAAMSVSHGQDQTTELSTTIGTPTDFVGKVYLYYPVSVDVAKKSIRDALINIQLATP